MAWHHSLTSYALITLLTLTGKHHSHLSPDISLPVICMLFQVGAGLIHLCYLDGVCSGKGQAEFSHKLNGPMFRAQSCERSGSMSH
jgi:hypothetical protein